MRGKNMSEELLFPEIIDECEEIELHDEPSSTAPIILEPAHKGNSTEIFDYYFRYPYLSAQQELDLSLKFTQDGCLKSAHQLVLAHMRYVVKLARHYISYGLPLNDLVQEGAVGLMKAVQRFNPLQGVRLISFAVHWIKSEIHEYIIRNWRLVKIATTKAQRKLFFNLRRLMAKKKQDMTQSFAQGGALLQQWHQEIAEELDVPLDEVQHMAQRFTDQEVALDQPIAGQDDNTSLAQILPSQSLNPLDDVSYEKDLTVVQKKLDSAFTHLSPRDQDIIKERFYQEKKTTFKDLAERYGVSVERIRQIEKTALGRLRDLIDIAPEAAF
jgi:RNA polymerase sigma-32 factor